MEGKINLDLGGLADVSLNIEASTITELLSWADIVLAWHKKKLLKNPKEQPEPTVGYGVNQENREL